MARRAPMSSRGSSHGNAEQALINRCVAGEQAAWFEFYSRYARAVRRFLRVLGVSRVEAEDACQEVFLQAHRKLAGFRGEAALSSWLYRLCATQANRARRRHVAVRVVEHLIEHQLRDAHYLNGALTEYDIPRVVSGALARMKERERHVLMLHSFEGRAGLEIAVQTGLSIDNVWRLLHVARRSFSSGLKAACCPFQSRHSSVGV